MRLKWGRALGWETQLTAGTVILVAYDAFCGTEVEGYEFQDWIYLRSRAVIS